MAKRKNDKPSSPPPTADYVHALYRSKVGEGDEARLRGIAMTLRALTRLEHKPTIPRQYRSITRDVRTPFVRDAWQRATAAMVNKTPVPHIEPRDNTEDARRAANIGEAWDQAAMDQMDADSNIVA